MDKPSLFKAYQRLFHSRLDSLQAVRRLTVYKPYESRRHKHLKPLTLPFAHVTELDTTHLCLCELEDFLTQLSDLRAIRCYGVETWCALQPLDIVNLLLSHTHLQRLTVRFQDVSGFTSLIAKPLGMAAPALHTLTIINIRDYDYPELVKLLTEMAMRLEEEESTADVQVRWQALEQRQLAKYEWLSRLNLKQFTFGFCHAWPASVWRQFLAVAPGLEHVELHGWTRLLLYRIYAAPIQAEAQQVLVECFSRLTSLRRLVLVDFWVTGEMQVPTTSASICLRFTSESLHKPNAANVLADIRAFVRGHAAHAVQVEFDDSWEAYVAGESFFL